MVKYQKQWPVKNFAAT